MFTSFSLLSSTAYRHYKGALDRQMVAMERLSSGMRINRAADDAAGLAISEKMRAQIRGLDQATRNAQDAVSFIQTGEGALNETHAILQRMRELTVQSANDTNTDSDRSAIQEEINQLRDEITRIGSQTEFNTIKLLDGSKIEFKIQVGANAGQTITIQTADMRAGALGLSTIDVTTRTGAETALTSLDDAIKSVSSQRSRFGAYQNRLEHTINNLANTSANLTAAESHIRDADMAQEIMRMTKESILSQVAMAMIMQARQEQMRVLELLK
ncbi:flagellin [Domibacillus enclensis]|uniref:Flagellin n=1 Tax=Domibacillus enclensis TaxID=1017273 RepID=A0A1N6SAD9_9BACI|nr:flagellin [Domibacillus enclensis]OXS79264.1 flagellin [Domibacillus enclensis]SIQ38060.1 flagellin [Domibacillus enclensis]